jgi:membrane-associated phospholipid phosphatase
VSWRPEEILLLAFALTLVAIVVFTGKLPPVFEPPLWRIARRLHVYFALCVCGLGLVLLRRRERGRAGTLLRDFAPFYAVFVLYEALADLTPVLRAELADASLVAIDRAIFGGDVALWAGRFASPLVSQLMAVCYGSYFVLPGLLAVAIYGAGERALFRDLMLAGVLTSVLGFVGYLLVPAVGPYAFQSELFPTRLPGGTYSPVFIKAIDDLRGVARDCFPSLHAAHGVVVMIFAYRFRRWVFLALLPVAVGLCLSTIYLRMHYAVDVLAGIATAALAASVAPRINRWWQRPPASPTAGSA